MTLAESRAGGTPAGILIGQARSRYQWVDIAKGIGIVLVVVGHAIGGMISAGLLSPKSAWGWSFFLIYTFHMPLFFALAGLFVAPRLASKSQSYLSGLFSRVVWAYFLWSSLQLLVISSMGDSVNSPYEFRPLRLIQLLWLTASQFWFLHALFLMSIAVWALHKAGLRRYHCLLTIGLYLLQLNIDFPVFLHMYFQFAIWFAVGEFFGRNHLDFILSWSRGTRWNTLAAALLLLIIWASIGNAKAFSYWSVEMLPAAAAGTLAIVIIATLLMGLPVTFMEYLGKNSMSIFVMHVLFTAGVRILLSRLAGVAETGFIFLTAVSLGIFGPLVFSKIAQRLGVSKLLGI